jgi:gliding motility-associated-like protein
VYSVHVSNACGSTADSIEVIIWGESLLLDFDTAGLCPGNTLTLDATQDFPAMYAWSTGSDASSIQVQVPGEYVVTVTSSCVEQTAVANVIAADTCKAKTRFYIPNIFSPNGDGINDVFAVHFNAAAKVIGLQGALYDRWGNLVFSSQTHPFIWNGTFDGRPVNPGVYVYRLILTYSNGINTVREIITGDVTLIR